MVDDKGTVSEKKAADTAEAYEKASGQSDQGEQTNDPVMDAIDESTKDIEQPDIGEPAWINKDYEEREQVEYVDTSGDDDSEDEKPAAKKTAAKKS